MQTYLDSKQYILPFVIAFVLSLLLTMVVRRLALRWQIVDRPEASPERKIQKAPVPLLGGVAIFLAMVMVVSYYTFFTHRVLGGYLLPKYLVGMLIAGLLLMIGGWLDDRRSLTPGKQIVWPLAASLVIIASGIGISYITNPFGGTINLDAVRVQLFTWGGLPYHFVLFADLFAFIWLMGMMYTTKFLDGLDGLVGGITTIGAFVLFFLSLTKDVAQPETALLSIIFAGACTGFLVFNFHPAKIFLGEGGSLFTGFMLGTLSIISGAKIATALLIMGIPILDVVWVIIRRLFFEKKSPFKTADKKHLHFRLLDSGFSHRGAVLFLYMVSLLFGVAALFLGSKQKVIAFVVLVGVMVLLGATIFLRYRQHRNQQLE
jgi:UDP-GlcNAc:undecaprenyl-phosphate/decaprenyl-phosphate GlcNAc-1-phosphate transferase